ncbi:MAG: metal ABC transporter ATP-binding protein [Gemmataceae bacterium]
MALPVSRPPLVAIRQLRVDRGGKPILHQLHCDIPRGGITALVGLNGSGKSTLLRTLLGEFPFRGTITYACGEDHSRPRPDHVGYGPQRLALDPTLPITVRELIGLATQRTPILFGVRRAAIERFRPLLTRFELWSRLETPVEGLSGGQLQRLLLALALEPQPELLLLDEPASGIDFRDLESFYELIRSVHRETGVTVLMVSHDLATVRKLATHVFCLRGGRVVDQGDPATVLTDANLARTFAPGADQAAH